MFYRLINFSLCAASAARPVGLRARIDGLLPLMLMSLFLGFMVMLPAHAARVMALNGQVQIQRGDKLLPAVVGSRLREGDEFISDSGAEAFVRFDDGARMALRSDSRLLVKDLKVRGAATARQKTLRVLKGGLRYISGKGTVKSKVTFETTTVTIGIRGTDIEIAVSEDPVNTDPAGTYLKVNTGAAVMEAVDGTQVEVDPGQVAFGGEPELVARGIGGRKRPAARKVEAPTGSLFKSGLLDKLMK
jgi:hypothetical protein